MMVATIAQKPLVGYRLVVLALVATGFLSFGLWVHHMFATGIPGLSLAFFQAASMAVAIPAGIQVFAWIATLASGRVRMTTPTLFVLGFLFTFVAGGLTGVMVAVVPFDWQAHDTYFVVAHLHYVLVGGMVFPLFAAFYYWTPYISRQALSERVGRWVFGLMFSGLHVTFFPMHITGLIGMPRRVHTYAEGYGWGWLNLLSSAGAFLIAIGVLLFIFDLVRRFRFAIDENAGNVWRAGTLEWLPGGAYSSRSIPIVHSREPLWDQPGLARDVEAGRYYLPGAPTGGRETIVTGALDAEPQFLLRMPMPGWAPVIAAVFTAGFFLLLTAKWVVPALACGAIAVAALLHWGWSLDPVPTAPVDIGGGIVLPTYQSGPRSQAWWAVVLLLLVAGSLYGCAVFSYLYLWTVAPAGWPTAASLPSIILPSTQIALLLASSGLLVLGDRWLRSQRLRALSVVVVLALLLLGVAVGMEFYAQRDVVPAASAHGALVYLFAALASFYAIVTMVLALFALARVTAGKLDRVRRVNFDNARLFWHYTVGQTIFGIALVHGFPRLVS
jgi:cytochrome c oxidase subunit I+III